MAAAGAPMTGGKRTYDWRDNPLASTMNIAIVTITTVMTSVAGPEAPLT